ncbi:hypothetical protein [Microbispora triticiradicis]|uniref:hypothetical protein n=1 Tax=Microbispora triticiradicis TaxID=2200763 RepID=UPI001AD78818|nr:hypothetical protein [Microbispora triticiradicis]MBO4273113.1 hypothetical protein [Microbispora triticiradicis]
MARIRSIKPEFFTSLTIANLDLPSRLTFIGLWTHCDDEGRCIDDARLIKAAIWPLDDRTAADVEEDLGALSESSLITRYEVAGRRYLAVCGWAEHQRINRATKSKYPSPDQAESPAAPPPASGNESSQAAHGGLSENSVSTHDRKGTGNREQGKEEPPAAAEPPARHDAPAEQLSVTQRSKRITDAYAVAEPMCKWPAINGIVIKAIKAEKWSDDEISAALLRLADEGRTVTVETLRRELAGDPPPVGRAHLRLTGTDGRPTSGPRATGPISEEDIW